MKAKLLIQSFKILSPILFIWLGVHNLHKDPNDTASILAIIFFSIILGFNLSILKTAGASKKKAEAIRKF